MTTSPNRWKSPAWTPPNTGTGCQWPRVANLIGPKKRSGFPKLVKRQGVSQVKVSLEGYRQNRVKVSTWRPCSSWVNHFSNVRHRDLDRFLPVSVTYVTLIPYPKYSWHVFRLSLWRISSQKSKRNHFSSLKSLSEPTRALSCLLNSEHEGLRILVHIIKLWQQSRGFLFSSTCILEIFLFQNSRPALSKRGGSVSVHERVRLWAGGYSVWWMFSF
jgi:hypothetical protein